MAVALSVAAAAGAGMPVADAADGGQGSLRELIEEVARQHGFEPEFIDAVIRVESAYDPLAVSRKGAQGLMQLMPGTAARLQVSDPFDPEENLRAGVRELSRLVDRFAGSYDLALAAYNAGEGAVERYRGVPPYSETRNYITRIMTLYTGRPYRLPGAKRPSAPVRLLRDPDSGQAVITNVGSTAGRGISISSATGGGTTLKGGFGSGSR